MMCPHIRIIGDMRVPPRTDADDVAEAIVEMAEAHGWGFTGVTRELTQAELDGQEPSPLTMEMVEKAVRDELSEKLVFLAGGILCDDAVDVAVNGVMERLRQQMGGGQ